MLLLDVHATHKNVQAYEFDRNNGIVLPQLAGHTTPAALHLLEIALLDTDLLYSSLNVPPQISRSEIYQTQKLKLLKEACGIATTIGIAKSANLGCNQTFS